MRTILSLGVLVSLGLAGCSSSTGPDDLNPSMDPGRAAPKTPCADPKGQTHDHHVTLSTASGLGSWSFWYTSNSMFLTTVCSRANASV
jgi:hypothetical protein